MDANGHLFRHRVASDRTRRRKLLLFGLALVMTGPAACAGDESAVGPAPSSSPSSAAEATPAVSPSSSRCSNEVDALGSGERAGGEVAGDVDGDGQDDAVYVIRDEEGPPGCQTFLVAETATGSLSIPTDEPNVSYSLQAPRVNSLVQVDSGGGLEILVDLEQGASTQFLGMFTVLPQLGLERVRIEGGSAYGDLFPYGGSVGHLEASDCTDEKGPAVSIAIATANTTDYTIRRVLYRLEVSSLQPLPTQEQPAVATARDVGGMSGFRNSPFGSCRQA